MTHTNVFTVIFVIAIAWLFIRQVEILHELGHTKKILSTAVVVAAFILVQNYLIGPLFQIVISIYLLLVYLDNLNTIIHAKSS